MSLMVFPREEKFGTLYHRPMSQAFTTITQEVTYGKPCHNMALWLPPSDMAWTRIELGRPLVWDASSSLRLYVFIFIYRDGGVYVPVFRM
jgi:hypothetical protein